MGKDRSLYKKEHIFCEVSKIKIMAPKALRILIVEDTPERQEILRNLFRDHAWVLVHTTDRAIRLLSVYDFDLISLDFDLAGDKKDDEVASFISRSRNSETKVIVHSMNPQGADKFSRFLPNAVHVPLSKMTKTNRAFKRIREELSKGVGINWAFVFRGDKLSHNAK